MSDDDRETSTRPRFLHGERPNGAHFWAGFHDVDEFWRQVERLAPVVPDDAVWDVTDSTYPPRREETP